MQRFVLAGLLAGLVAADWPAEPDPAPWQRTVQGVDVQDVVIGSGDMVVDRTGVQVHYVGMLTDGTVFDSSRERATPFGFRVGRGDVIPGWEEGLLGMRVGGTRRLVIPPELGYGERIAGNIPPGSTLYFEVELIGVEAPRVPPAAPGEVADDAWYPSGTVQVADLHVGSGAKAKLKAGRRACLDYAVFDAAGQLVENTWSRAGCTWYALEASDLSAPIEAGIAGMKAGGLRLVRDGDRVIQVRCEAVGR